jgi:hypothetical protein
MSSWCNLNSQWLMKHLAFLKDVCIFGKHFQHSLLDRLQPHPLNCCFSHFLSYSVPHRHVEGNIILLCQMIALSWSMSVQLRLRMILVIIVVVCSGQVLHHARAECVKCYMEGAVPKAHSSKHVNRKIGIPGPNYDILKAWLSCI